MHIGRMERKITIQQPVYTVDANTNFKKVSSWTTYKICWASWKHEMSNEVFETGQMVAKDTFDWKIRYYDASDVKQDMRILYDSGYYYIIGVKELGRKEALQISTIKKDNDGS